jgi:hypothetical protein
MCLAMFAGVALCSAQEPAQAPAPAPAPDQAQAAPDRSVDFTVEPNHPTYSFVYCSGFVASEPVPGDVRVISGEQSDYKITFSNGDYIYINRGASQGVKVGDRFEAVRPETDPNKVPWFKGQEKLFRAMGKAYTDLGHARVVNVHQNVSIAQVTFTCGTYLRRGDILRPFTERPEGPYKEAAAFDHFAPVDGKPTAMLVTGKDFQQMYGRDDAVYVNLGSSQGVKVGDYFRIFRYQGLGAQTAPVTRDYQYKMYGFGSTPTRYTWKDLPRELLGEGIVLNVSKNTSTVLITYSGAQMYAGDYAELE